MVTHLARAALTVKGRGAAFVVVLLDLVHPLFHQFEGGSFDQILVWLNATVAQAQ